MLESNWSKCLMIAGAAFGAAPAVHAQAQYFRVVGVAPGDVLNIREQPDAEARLVATVPFRVRRIRGFGRSGGEQRGTHRECASGAGGGKQSPQDLSFRCSVGPRRVRTRAGDTSM